MPGYELITDYTSSDAHPLLRNLLLVTDCNALYRLQGEGQARIRTAPRSWPGRGIGTWYWSYTCWANRQEVPVIIAG